MSSRERKLVSGSLRHVLPLLARLAGRKLKPYRRSELASLDDAWKEESIVGHQTAVVSEQLEAMRQNKPIPVFAALVDILRANIPDLDSCSLLDVGCASGYYSEVLRIAGIKSLYRGCDYSEYLILAARKRYPMLPFDIEDAARLSYQTRSFDIVVSGGCILHMSNYTDAIKEASRVARKYVVFHRTPVLSLVPSQMYSKQAYGVRMMELHFNEQELVREFRRAGLGITDVNTHMVGVDPSCDVLSMKTYLCEVLKR